MNGILRKLRCKRGFVFEAIYGVYLGAAIVGFGATAHHFGKAGACGEWRVEQAQTRFDIGNMEPVWYEYPKCNVDDSSRVIKKEEKMVFHKYNPSSKKLFR